MPFFIRPVTGITLLVALMATAIGSVTAPAQSGSAGGSIGNDEKSLSGSRATPRSAEPERRSRRPEREEQHRSSGGGGGNRFDGSWSFVAVGTTCQATVSGAGIIANGRAIGAGTTGGVNAGGVYHAVSVGNDGIVTNVVGHLSGNSGGGTFTRSDGCNGRRSSTRQ